MSFFWYIFVAVLKKAEKMKKSLILFSVLMLSGLSWLSAGVIVVEGKYQNKSLYIYNSFASSGVGFCAYQVSINGQMAFDEVNSSTFEIDFTQFNLKTGDNIIVEIKHKEGCAPRVLNPDALKPKPTFEIASISVGKNGVLKWVTKNENGSLAFIVEQYKWNKWIYVGEVQGVGTPDHNEYSFSVTPHSGENKFRVKQVGLEGKTKISSEVTYTSNASEIAYTLSQGSANIYFSGSTFYEVYDFYGNILKKGFGKNISITNLPKGKYHLCFDNRTTEFKKK